MFPRCLVGQIFIILEKERIVAAFVGIDESENKMKSLRFTKSNIDDGSVSTEGEQVCSS